VRLELMADSVMNKRAFRRRSNGRLIRARAQFV
jgi:hypothetical protein